MGLKPDGGTVCLQLGNVAADNINARAAGFRDTISGEEGIERLDRPERLDRDRRLPGLHQRPGRSRQPADGRHLHRQSRSRRLHPGRRLGAVRAAGLRPGHRSGHGQAPESKDLVIVAGDTLPPQIEALKAGRSHAQIGQRPFEMGYRAPSVMIDLIEGKDGRRSAVHRARRMHARERRQLPGQVRQPDPTGGRALRRSPAADRSRRRPR